MMSDDKNEYEFDPIDITEFTEIESDTTEEKSLTVSENIPETQGKDVDTQVDYENTRKTYYDLVEKGQRALDNLLDVAASSEHPRAYEVAAQMIKTITDTNDRIVELQLQMEKIVKQRKENEVETEEAKNAKTVNNNVIFAGTMKEFQEMYKKMTGKDQSNREKSVSSNDSKDEEG